MTPQDISRQLCERFCSEITVNAVPSGLAVSTALQDASGDRFTFFVVESDGAYRLEDDGSYLAHLVGRDIPITEGTRGNLLDAILRQSGAYWDRETFEIKTDIISKDKIAETSVAFLSALVRVRDLELLTRENIRSTFRDDVIAAIVSSFRGEVAVEQDAIVDKDLSDFPADIVIRPLAGGIPAALFLVNSDAKLNEALLAHAYSELQHISDIAIIGLLEEREMKQISKRRFQRAQNRSLPMPIFRGDEGAAMDLVRKQLELSRPANLLPA